MSRDRESEPARKQYRKLWMRDWRRKQRAGRPDGRAKNGKNQKRDRGRFVACDWGEV